MIKEYIIKIGEATLKIKENITSQKNNKKNNSQKYKIEKESIEKILTQNKKEKKHPYKFTIVLVLLVATYLKNLIAIEIITITIIILLLYKSYPQLKEKQKQEEITKELPYVLRQISIELQAGTGLFDAINSIADGDYGIVSEEFKITIEEIHYGTNYNQAFDNLIERNNNKILKKTINQIKRTLNTGGNLSKTLNSLAKENTENMKMKYREYSEKLNSFMLLYMFTAVLIPVILFIMIIAATTVIGPIIDGKLLLVLYLFFFPLVVLFMIFIIKKMEPTSI